MFGTLNFFFTFWNLHKEVSWGWDPSLNVKFIYVVLYMPFLPEGNFVQYLQCTRVLTETYYMRSGVEFSTWDITWTLKILDFGASQTSHFQIREVQPVFAFKKKKKRLIGKHRSVIIQVSEVGEEV